MIASVTTVLLAVAGVPQEVERERVRPPNLLFVMADDLGPEWLSCYGGRELVTPNLDALAESGMRFSSAWSMPKCTPTRATLLTGQYPFRHGWVNHWDVPRWGAGCHFDPQHNLTFARLLRDAGYATAIAGKWQINDFRVQPDVLDAHGFDEWCVWTGYETGNPPSAKRYWDPYVHTNDGSRTHEGRFGTDVFVDFLIGFLEKHPDKPMLLYFPMALPHGPLTDTPLDPDAKGMERRQQAMVRYIDHAVGRLVGALEEQGLRERTIVVFTGDNGSSRGLSARMGDRTIPGGKGRMGENGVRTPLVVSGPGRVPAGVVSDVLTDTTDWFPTLCELGGAALPEDAVLDGRSIASLLLGQTDSGRRSWILAMGGGVARIDDDDRVVPAKPYADRVVRDSRFKLWWEDGRASRLFDLSADPDEKHNLIDSDDPDARAAQKRLSAIVTRQPAKDAAPRYDPTPSQPWDRKRKR